MISTLSYLDHSLFFLLNDFVGRSAFFDALIIFCAVWLQYPLIAALLVVLWCRRESVRENIRTLGEWVAAVVLSRLIITTAIRFFYHRPRPFVALGLHPLVFDASWSFPSGHAAFFFALAASVYFYEKKWGQWLYAAAIIICASRVIAGVHYPSDILGGAMVGIASAYLIHYVCVPLFIRRIPPHA